MSPKPQVLATPAATQPQEVVDDSFLGALVEDPALSDDEDDVDEDDVAVDDDDDDDDVDDADVDDVESEDLARESVR